MEGFGERLTMLREARAWTRRELAKRAGLHEKHLDKVEHGGRYRLEAETIIKLARTLGVSSDFLLGLTDDPRPRRPRQRDGAATVDSSPARHQRGDPCEARRDL